MPAILRLNSNLVSAAILVNGASSPVNSVLYICNLLIGTHVQLDLLLDVIFYGWFVVDIYRAGTNQSMLRGNDQWQVWMKDPLGIFSNIKITTEEVLLYTIRI